MQTIFQLYICYTHVIIKNLAVSLIRKGKPNIPEDRIINLLQINGNHVCYIVDLLKFLKCFMHLKKDQEIFVLCFVVFKNEKEV